MKIDANIHENLNIYVNDRSNASVSNIGNGKTDAKQGDPKGAASIGKEANVSVELQNFLAKIPFDLRGAAQALYEYQSPITSEKLAKLISYMQAGEGMDAGAAALLIVGDTDVADSYDMNLISDILGGRFSIANEIGSIMELYVQEMREDGLDMTQAMVLLDTAHEAVARYLGAEGGAATLAAAAQPELDFDGVLAAVPDLSESTGSGGADNRHTIAAQAINDANATDIDWNGGADKILAAIRSHTLELYALYAAAKETGERGGSYVDAGVATDAAMQARGAAQATGAPIAAPATDAPIAEPATNTPITESATSAPIAELAAGATIAEPATSAPISDPATGATIAEPTAGLSPTGPEMNVLPVPDAAAATAAGAATAPDAAPASNAVPAQPAAPASILLATPDDALLESSAVGAAPAANAWRAPLVSHHPQHVVQALESEKTSDNPEISASAIKEQYSIMLIQLNLLRASLKLRPQSTPAKAAALSRIELLEDGVRLIDNLNNRHQYFQIPFNHAGRDAELELFVMKRGGKKKRIDIEDATLFLALNTDNIGRVEALVHIGKNKNVSLNLRAGNERILALMRERRVDLHDAFTKIGYKLARVTFMTLEENITAATAVTHANKLFHGSRNLVDYRI